MLESTPNKSRENDSETKRPVLAVKERKDCISDFCRTSGHARDKYWINPGSENCKLIEASKQKPTAVKKETQDKEKETASFGNGADLKRSQVKKKVWTDSIQSYVDGGARALMFRKKNESQEETYTLGSVVRRIRG